MKKLLSLPPNLAGCFHKVTGLPRGEWYCTHDPVGSKLGSGGGTAWLLAECHREEAPDTGYREWLRSERRILVHAGGQGRRLPAYAPSGKVLTPIPVFRWERGQRLGQDLLSLQTPLYERIMAAAPKGLTTMIVSGDVLVRAGSLPAIPQADVVCFGLWTGAETASHHGVFLTPRNAPGKLHRMLQKPAVEELGRLSKEYYYMTDIGVWLLSARAVEALVERSTTGKEVSQYDLYGQFGCSLGENPSVADGGIAGLSVAVLPLAGGEFYHFGTSAELISSMVAVQNVVDDQRLIMHNSRKPHPAMFVQNAEVGTPITADNRRLWIENSVVGAGWKLSEGNIITGIPGNDWQITLGPGQCADMAPIGADGYAVRPYGMDDAFRGPLQAPATTFLGQPFVEWAAKHGVDPAAIAGGVDIQGAALFPVTGDLAAAGRMLAWMLDPEGGDKGAKELWAAAEKTSADGISDTANLERLAAQRRKLRAGSWTAIARNHRHSVFHQVDLEDAAGEFAANNIPAPPALPPGEPLMARVHNAMFRSEVARLTGLPHGEDSAKAFGLLRDTVVGEAARKGQRPRNDAYADQIVWARSPARIDLAGGWTDTPPHCLVEGGAVVNIAVELNGQPPLQAFVKPCLEYHVILRSIDLGAAEVVKTYGELQDFHHVGSPFSIPKAALALAGFLPEFCAERHATLEEQLCSFGCGIEVTMLSAIPAGSGLGTSSILAATVLGAVGNFCGLGWDKDEIGRRTMALEQLLTTGGGWQDQFGGLYPGAKLLTTAAGPEQSPQVRWLPQIVFEDPGSADCHLLYYTGITRTAKDILAQIVRRMFLNQNGQIAMLREMKAHAYDMFEALQQADFRRTGLLVRKTWEQNQALDSGTNPPEVRRITELVDDYCLGYKLPGAGGGGYLYMVAKDPGAAARIRAALKEAAPNRNARFVAMKPSATGLQISRS